MWTRKELKDRAKAGLKRNYWKSVLVALIFSALFIGYTSTANSGASTDDATGFAAVTETLGTGDLAAFFALFAGVMLVSVVIAAAIRIFLINPMEVGIAKFFCHANDDVAPLSDILVGYKQNYMANVKTLFLKKLYVALWSLLLVVPGIIKSLEYSMVEYLIAEDPTLTAKEALAKSKAMMQGHKWNAFVLQLSFLGWDILSGLTLGLLNVFYVAPYKMLTDAALYQKLKTNA